MALKRTTKDEGMPMPKPEYEKGGPSSTIANEAIRIVGSESDLMSASNYEILKAEEISKMRVAFDDYAYLISAKTFINLKTGVRLDKEQFNDSFSTKFAAEIDASDPKKAPKVVKTNDASFAFIRSELAEEAGNKKADTFVIDNKLKLGEFHVNKRGVKCINIFKGLTIKSVEGCTAPFHDLLERLFANEQDKGFILDYMAAMIQHCGGEKIRHAPFIQGVQGNGKSSIGKIIKEIIGGEECATPSNNDINEKYNGWALGKLFATVEEVKVKDHSAMDSLKTVISEENLSFRLMKRDAFDADNKCNLMFFSNHKDALIIDPNERRYSVFFTKQQSVEDIVRDFGGSENGFGDDMPGVAYFNKFYHWLREEQGYEKITHELVNRDISNFSLSRAPKTSHVQEAINHSLSNNAMALQNAIYSGEVFGEGRVVSYKQANDFLRISARQLNGALKELGFIDPDKDESKPASYKGKTMPYTVWSGVKHRFAIHKDEVTRIPNGQVACDVWKGLIPRSYEISQTGEM